MLDFKSLRDFKQRKANFVSIDSDSADQGTPRFFRRQKIKKVSLEEIEPHEVLLDSLAKKREKEMGISEKKLEVPLLKKILQIFFGFCVLLILILFAKTFQLQIIEGKKLADFSNENKFIISKTQAERGVIYDKNLNQLVFNLAGFDLILNKNELSSSPEESGKILERVANILGKNTQDLEKEIKESGESMMVISQNITREQLILLETQINDLPGFQIRNSSTRFYPEGENFSHLLGYTGKISSEELKTAPQFYSVFDYVGRSGIEKSYEETLRKNPGQLQIERDALGNIISQEVISQPQSGKSLVLWLDSDLQKKIKEVLEERMKVIGSKNAVGVAINPKTGGILALVSLPSFDNNLFQKGADAEKLQQLLDDREKLQPLFNRVIAGRYLTGSTIKPFIASAVLEEKIIDPSKKINDDKGYITIPNPWDPTAPPTIKRDWDVHGWTDLRKALAESCNVYFYTVGGGYGNQEGLGPTRIKKYLQLFGWDKKTGIDLPGETEGFIPDKDWKKKTFNQGWSDGDTYNLSIGQGFLKITPLEVAASYAAIANGGKLLEPHIVQKIVNTSSGQMEVVEEIEPEIIRQDFISAENIQIVREGMRQAVTGENSPHASAVRLNSLPQKVAVKTGTAELGGDYYQNWLSAFGPYEDPEIVLTIMIENVKGFQAAVIPAGQEILEWYFSR